MYVGASLVNRLPAAAKSEISPCPARNFIEPMRPTETTRRLQIGHPPLESPTTSGCIGHVHESGGSSALPRASGESKRTGGAAAAAAIHVRNSRRFSDIGDLDTPGP